VLDEKDSPKLTRKLLAHRFGNALDLGGQLERGVQHAVGKLGKGGTVARDFFGYC